MKIINIVPGACLFSVQVSVRLFGLSAKIVTYSHIFSRFCILWTSDQCRVESRFATMVRVMCFLRMAILILLFVALCDAASDSETLVLRPIASEYQHVSTKAGGEFSVKRQLYNLLVILLPSLPILCCLNSWLRLWLRSESKHGIVFIRCIIISHFRNHSTRLPQVICQTRHEKSPGASCVLYLQLKLKHNKLWQLVLDGGILSDMSKIWFQFYKCNPEDIVLGRNFFKHQLSFFLSSNVYSLKNSTLSESGWRLLRQKTSFLIYKLRGRICPHSSEYFAR